MHKYSGHSYRETGHPTTFQLPVHGILYQWNGMYSGECIMYTGECIMYSTENV